MRIAIDGFNLALPDGTGVATYGRNLAAAIKRLGHQVEGVFAVGVNPRTPSALREIAFFESLARPEPSRWRWAPAAVRDLIDGGAPLVEIEIAGRVEAGAFAERLPRFDRILAAPELFNRAQRHFARFGRFLEVEADDPPDVMHWTYPLPLRLAGAANVYTVHDLVPLKLPHTTLDRKRIHYRLIEHCLRTADHVCAVSETTRRDILQMFPGTPRERVGATWQAVEPPTAAPSPDDLARTLSGLHGLTPQGYFLFFGAIEPKKNVGRLIEAYLGAGLQTPLVVAGAKAWAWERELRALPTPGVVRLEHLPRSLLMSLVRGARAVVFPSLYEGFGLPVLEAMQLGAPVITSTGGALPETAGEAALLVDPYDVAALTAALRRLDADAELRATLSTAGLARAETFSMSRYAERLERMYAEVAEARRPHGSPAAREAWA